MVCDMWHVVCVPGSGADGGLLGAVNSENHWFHVVAVALLGDSNDYLLHSSTLRGRLLGPVICRKCLSDWQTVALVRGSSDSFHESNLPGALQEGRKPEICWAWRKTWR